MLLPLQIQLNLQAAVVTRDSKGVWTRPDILTPDINEIGPEWRDLRSRMKLCMNFPHTPDDPYIYDVLTGRVWPITVGGNGTTTYYDENRGYLLDKQGTDEKATYWTDADPLIMDASAPRSFSMLARTASSGVESQIPWTKSDNPGNRYHFYRNGTSLYTRHAGDPFASISGLTATPDNVVEHWNCTFVPTTGNAANVLIWFDGAAQSVSYSDQSNINADSTVDFGHMGTYNLLPTPATFSYEGG